MSKPLSREARLARALRKEACNSSSVVMSKQPVWHLVQAMTTAQTSNAVALPPTNKERWSTCENGTGESVPFLHVLLTSRCLWHDIMNQRKVPILFAGSCNDPPEAGDDACSHLKSGTPCLNDRGLQSPRKRFSANST